MLENLIQVTSDLLEKGEVGTLFLGKGESARRLFFSGEEVYLLQDQAQRRVVPAKQLFRTDRVSASATESIYAEIREGNEAPANILVRSGLLDESDRAQYLELERLEETLYALEISRDRFSFDAGNVPEEILRTEPGGDTGTPASVLLAAIGQRLAEAKSLVKTFPRTDELPVISESGLAALNEPSHWLFAQVAALVDGFRTIYRITEDSVFYPHRTVQIMTAATRKGWIRKTLFREFQGLDQREVDAETAPELIDQLTSAVKVAVDDLPLRGHLVRLYQIAGDPAQASQQLELVGDSHRGRRDLTSALASYRSALELTPGSERLRGRISEITIAEAAAAHEAGKLEEARHWYEEAIQALPDRIDLRLQYLSTYGEDEDSATREALRIADEFKRGGDLEEVIDFVATVAQTYPAAENLRRRWVNLLLDAGRTDEAIRELDMLACQLIENGEPQRANEILQKIGRLDPSRAIARDSIKDPSESAARRSRYRPSWAALSLVALFICFGFYQHFAYQQIAAKKEAFAAMVEVDLTDLDESEYPAEADRSRKFLAELDQLEEAYPFTIWIHPLRQVRLAAENRVDFIESEIRRGLNSLLTEAREAHVRGQLDRAVALYQQLDREARNDSWKNEARTKIQEITNYRHLSGALLKQGQSAERAGRIDQAFHAYRELLIEYPRSQAARGVRLPLLLVASEPNCVVADLRGRELGKTPLAVKVHPWEPTELRLIAPDGRKMKALIEDPIEYRQFFSFDANRTP